MLNVTILMILFKSRFCRWNVTPFLHYGLFDFLRVDSGSGADLLGNINTCFCGLQFGNQFCDMFAGSLRLQATLLFWHILD